MSEMLERIEALEAEIKALRAEAEAKESKPWEPWKPEVGGRYYFVDGEGISLTTRWDDDSYDTARHAIRNVFPTEDSAERHTLRLRSMRPTCPVPKVGDEVFVAVCELNGFCADPRTWRDSHAHYTAYLLGRVFTTQEAAEAWIAEFGEAWTTLEDEAK